MSSGSGSGTAVQSTLKLRKLDMESVIKPGRVIIALGKRGSGKSVLLRDILYYLRSAQSIVCMSPTEPGNGFYKALVPSSFVFEEFRADKIEQIVTRQAEMAKKGQATHTVIVCDDCMYDAQKIFKLPAIRSIFMNGRHFNITFLLGVQYCISLPSWARAQVDLVFSMREPIFQNRERLYKMFFGCFPTLPAFCAALSACTEDYQCLVSDNTVQSNDLQDSVFWYRAPMRLGPDGKPNFRAGAPSLWRFHEELVARASASKAASNATGIKAKPVGGAVTVRKLGVKKTLKL